MVSNVVVDRDVVDDVIASGLLLRRLLLQTGNAVHDVYVRRTVRAAPTTGIVVIPVGDTYG